MSIGSLWKTDLRWTWRGPAEREPGNKYSDFILLPPISWGPVLWPNPNRGQIAREFVDVNHCWKLKCYHMLTFILQWESKWFAEYKLDSYIYTEHGDWQFLFSITAKPYCWRKYCLFACLVPLLTEKDTLEFIFIEFQLWLQ